MNYEVRFDFFKIGNVVESFLGDDFCDAFNVLYNDFSLIERKAGESLVTGDRLVGEQAHHNIAILACRIDDIDVARVDEVGAHADIYFLVHSGVF